MKRIFFRDVFVMIDQHFDKNSIDTSLKQLFGVGYHEDETISKEIFLSHIDKIKCTIKSIV